MRLRTGRAALLACVVAMVGTTAITAAAASTVPVAEYVQTVCTAKDALHTTLVATRPQIEQASQAFKDSPSQATAVGLKTAFVGFLQTTADADTAYVGEVKSAGVPDVKQGSTFAKAYLASERSSLAKLRGLVSEAKQINTKTPRRFEADVKAIQRHIESLAAAAQRAARKTPVLQRAPAGLQPIADLITSDAATCPASP